MLGLTQHHVKNSRHLANGLKSLTLHDDDMFTSIDVVSLFTNTPMPETMGIIKTRLQKDTTLADRTKLEIEDIMAQLDFVLSTTYFTLRNTVCQQKFGTVMGNPVSPIIAKLVMEHLEQEAIATAPIDCRPRMWESCVDDTLEMIKTGMTQYLTDHLNRVDGTNSSKFTRRRSRRKDAILGHFTS